jgi:hypothetical protein
VDQEKMSWGLVDYEKEVLACLKTIKKSPLLEIRKNQSKVSTSLTSHREFQRRKDTTV